jgi:hypothetical protein
VTLGTTDRLEVLDLYSRYCHAIDTLDGLTWLETFTSDAVFDLGPSRVSTGSDEISAWFRGFVDSGASVRHVVTNVTVGEEDESIIGRAYLSILSVPSGQTVATGVYRDRLAKTPDGWRFAERHLAYDARTASAE